MLKRFASLVFRILLFLGQAALIVFVTLVLAGAFAARQRADLEPWHTTELESEFRAGDEIHTLEEYLQTEDRVFQELESKIVSIVSMGEAEELNRFARSSRSFPEKQGVNWNRTQVLSPEVQRGGVLMLHGMTDSPYSLRHFEELFRQRGFYVLNLRMPGHGTIPAELARVDWRDWSAAVRIGAADVQSRLDPQQPFYILGYSNGGSLALEYTMDSLNDTALRIPDRLFLVSPMLGVSGLARFGRIYYWLGKLEFFHKSRWMDIYPEFDPHKYNSFPMNGPRQSLALTSRVNKQIRSLANSGGMSIMPPVLTFQSLVDATVITNDIMTRLYDRLPANGSELVLFDVNRAGVLEFFVGPQHDAFLKRLVEQGPSDYAVTLISNQESGSGIVGAKSRRAHSSAIEYQELGYEWPENLYSLSHVALPFPPEDQIYGYAPILGEVDFPQLGRAQMVGESGAMIFPASLFTRVRSNPFHGYMEHRMIESIEKD